MLRKVVIVGLVTCAVLPRSAAHAQSITQLLEPIQFGDWKEVAQRPTAREYFVEFPSAVVTPYSENNTVPVQVFLPNPSSGPVPCVVILHFWGATDLRVERNLALDLARNGIASAIVTLPYHLSRAPAGTRSGAMAIQPNPIALRTTMTQSVLDVRRTVDWLHSRPEFDKTKIGIAGTSLGAIVSSLTVAVDHRFFRAAVVLGGADIAHIMWNSSRVVRERDQLRRGGYTEQKLRAALKPVEPSEYLDATTTPRSFFIGARYDTVVPPEDTHKLLKFFPNREVVWMDTGHYGGFLVQKRMQKAVVDFFTTEFNGRIFSAPKSLDAPTVRIGFQATLDSRYEVVIGVDVWKSNKRGDITGSLLLSPQSPSLFIGTRTESSLSFGVSLSPGRTSPSLIWSIIL